MTIKSNFKELALLVAGTLLSVVVEYLFPGTTLNKLLIILIIILSILLLIYGGNLEASIYNKIYFYLRKGVFLKKPIIGIINEIDWELPGETHPWTDIAPKAWKQFIENNLKVKVSLINTNINLNKYLAILNPYGSVYPEEDTVKHNTMNKIFEYVNNGGLFINVSDIPGYYAFDSRLKTKIDTTPAQYTSIIDLKNITTSLVPVRPYELTPFMHKLALRVKGFDRLSTPEHPDYVAIREWEKFSNGILLEVLRAVVIEKNVKPLIAPKSFGPDKYAPLFTVIYGDGVFFISLFELKHNNQASEMVKENVLNIIRSRY